MTRYPVAEATIASVFTVTAFWLMTAGGHQLQIGQGILIAVILYRTVSLLQRDDPARIDDIVGIVIGGFAGGCWFGSLINNDPTLPTTCAIAESISILALSIKPLQFIYRSFRSFSRLR